MPTIPPNGDANELSRIHFYLYRPERERLTALHEAYQANSGLKVSLSFFVRWLVHAVSVEDITQRASPLHKT